MRLLRFTTGLEPTGITVNQFSLLMNLSRLGSGSISELAAYVGLERTTLTRTLKPLTERGFIKDVSEKGRRDKKLQLTSLGKETLNKGFHYGNQRSPK
ncbi:Transcriptional regulator SlyA [[Clostridium] hylemonae DSM 15053]|uniref:MarR family transcriptional regulator n=1 Tax=[Clostridium] hylemonae TaxID=89153 RepID=UPI001252C39F|nr:MarR family transcriptional regulator [[Clostridium] hylemonae]QEK18986.1 Transcriptional regulator SlyA [[Clostridium] hylemonae DSM 15053]